ncbi:hypothetical protein [Paenibacillus sp. JJ1683]
MASLKEVNNELVRDLIEEFNKIKMDNNLTLVQIYGQWTKWTKDGQIIRDNALKKKIDHLSTLYATFSILKKWL